MKKINVIGIIVACFLFLILLFIFYMGYTHKIDRASEKLNLRQASENATGIERDHVWVNLGLSVCWATCNVGADYAKEYGNLYAWGETEVKRFYNWDTYKLKNEKGFTKYCTKPDCGVADDKTVLDNSDDVAHNSWGGRWRLPTKNEWVELIDNCSFTWTTEQGVGGCRLCSRINGNSIFLPAAGGMDEDGRKELNTVGIYWSSSLYLDKNKPVDASFVYFNEDEIKIGHNNRTYGYSVRPVIESR